MGIVTLIAALDLHETACTVVQITRGLLTLEDAEIMVET